MDPDHTEKHTVPKGQSLTEIIDDYYAEVQDMGGNRWDTSSLIRRFRK